MAAKANVPGEAFPCAHRFRGRGPLLQGPWMHHPRWEWVTLLWERAMPAKAMVPGKAPLQHPPLSGPWAPPTTPWTLLRRALYYAAIRSHSLRIMSFIISDSCHRSDSS